MPDQTKTPDAVVIIPHRNDLGRLMRCLDALQAQDRSAVEVVVVDNGSTVDLAELRCRYPWMRLLEEATPGAAAARNLGVAETAAPWLFFLDADCVPAADWLATALHIAADSSRQITGGRVRVFDETPRPRSGAEVFEAVFAFDQATYIHRKGFSVTANLLVSRHVFDAVGPFESGVSEDVEWCQRAQAAGYPVRYAPDLCVAHPTRSDWPALAAKWRRLTQQMAALALHRGHQGRVLWVLHALAMPLSIPLHALRILRHPELTRVERLSGLGTLLRLRLSRMIWMLACLRG